MNFEPTHTIEFKSKCHPEVNGRKPEAGDTAVTLMFPLESGCVLKVHIGNQGYNTLRDLFIAQYKDDHADQELEECESGGARLKINEDTGQPFWELWGADWMDSDNLEDGENFSLAPHSFPIGTNVIVREPDPTSDVSQEFYKNYPINI